mgnify:CR=1 FL=1
MLWKNLLLLVSRKWQSIIFEINKVKLNAKRKRERYKKNGGDLNEKYS